MGGAGAGIAQGLYAGAQAYSQARLQKHQETLLERERKAENLQRQMEGIAGNIQKLPRDDKGQIVKSDEYNNMLNSLTQSVQQYRSLYAPHESGALVQRLQKWLHLGGGQAAAPAPGVTAPPGVGAAEYGAGPGKKPAAKQPADIGMPTVEGEMAVAPRPGDPLQEKESQWQRMKAMIPGLTEEQHQQWLGVAKDAEKWQRSGEPFEHEGKTYQIEFDPSTGQSRTTEVAGRGLPPEEKKPPKPLNFKSNAATGGLETIEDPNTGETYHAGNISTAPPEVKSAWQAIMAQQEQQAKGKAAEADKRFQQGLERQNQAFQQALQKQDYGLASRTVKSAKDEYQAAIDRMNTMDKNIVNALKGDQQAMLSLAYNHIGMTLGAQRGARINRATFEEAVQSAPYLARIGAKFDERGVLSGVTLTEDQMHQMVNLAHEKVDILKDHVERIETEYSEVLSLKKPSPGDLKEKAKPKGETTGNIDDEIMGAIKKVKP